MQRQQIPIEQQLIRPHLPNFLREVFLIDKPRTTIISKDLFGNELLVLFEVVDQVLEVLPSEWGFGGFAELLNEVADLDTHVVIIYAVTFEHDLVQRDHYLRQTADYDLVVGGDQDR